jgi:hypothetical protein
MIEVKSKKDFDFFNTLINKNERDRFDLLNSLKKHLYEFRVSLEEKDTFMEWLKILSSVEFRVDVNFNNIEIRDCDTTCLFRVRASGKKEDIDRWFSNLKHITDFINSSAHDINYVLTKEVTKEESVIS